jgi:hypothetical protein
MWQQSWLLQQHKKLLQNAIATLLLATTFNQSHMVAIGRYCNKYGLIATKFQHGNKPIF